MSFLTGLHGTAALVLLCSLLFLEEAGVPLPILPGDAILIVGGLFIARGAMSPWLFLPTACLATIAGSLVARGWARAVGSRGLTAMARRLGAEKVLERATERVQAAGPVGIAVSRLLPGLRVYTSMVAGAADVSLRDFLLGVVPAVVIWVAIFTILGIAVGAPAMALLSRAQRLAAEGAVLLAVGAAAYLGVRHIPVSEREAGPVHQAPRPYRVALALCLDAGIVATVVSGITQLSDVVIGFPDLDGLVDVALVAIAFLLFYIAAARRGAGGTLGEALLAVSYRRQAPHAQT